MDKHISLNAVRTQLSDQAQQSIIVNMTNPPPRKNGIANVRDALSHAGVASRTTLIAWERDGRFPKRISLGRGRVGWRWADLYAWSNSLQAVES